MSAPSLASDALVLDCRDHGEADIIVTLLSPQHGKVSALAKHAKKSKRRFVNKLEIFSFLHIINRNRPASGFALLQEADLLNGFINIRRSIPSYFAASVIREVLLATIHEGERDEELFKLTLWAFHMLDRGQPPQTVIALFLPRFFAVIGYRPEFGKCLSCNALVHASLRQEFSIHAGSVLCPRCTSTTHHTVLNVSAGTIRFLQSTQNEPLERLNRLKASGMILTEALALLYRYGKHLLHRDIISWKMLSGFQ